MFRFFVDTTNGKWHLGLYHQCDAWDIYHLPDFDSYDTNIHKNRQSAIEALRLFIAEGQVMLEHLESLDDDWTGYYKLEHPDTSSGFKHP